MASAHLDKNGNSIYIIPRVGDEHQAELPPLIAELNLVNATYRADNRHNLFTGLVVPVTGISQKQFIPFKNSFVPEVCRECWSDAEKASFLLSLYIFKKNFVEVRQFVESKKMETVLSYYYGEFYGSTEYRTWLGCRRRKNKKRLLKVKKCLSGQRIFSGWRQQEILSRLRPFVPEDQRDTLLEVSKKFGRKKISLSDYVFTLKTMVGTKKLVEAVGIGLGERDLTLGLSKSNQSIPLHPEIPTGKACSSLTTSEIVNILTGDYRLSKARSKDLFWKAIWPRLLARGWNSEEVAGFKNSLVFLAPGVKKFSRGELVEGMQYFDSVINVLDRVAKDPGLIEVDADEDNGGKKRKEVDNDGDNNDDADLSSRQKHRYLQPRSPNQSGNAKEFTVADTSLSGSKTREFRGLPVETLNLSNLPSQTGSYQVKLSSSTSSIRGVPEESVNCALYNNTNVSGSSHGNEPRLLIDLNLPYVSPESENQTSEQNDHYLANSSAIGAGSEQQDTEQSLPSSSATEPRAEAELIVHSRRHSTRYWSPTTRALEATANAYLTVNRRRKSMEGSSHDETAPRPSQRARLVVNSQAEEAKNCNASNGGM